MGPQNNINQTQNIPVTARGTTRFCTKISFCKSTYILCFSIGLNTTNSEMHLQNFSVCFPLSNSISKQKKQKRGDFFAKLWGCAMPWKSHLFLILRPRQPTTSQIGMLNKDQIPSKWKRICSLTICFYFA